MRIQKDGMTFMRDYDLHFTGNEILTDGAKKTGIGEFIRKSSPLHCHGSYLNNPKLQQIKEVSLEDM